MHGNLVATTGATKDGHFSPVLSDLAFALETMIEGG
jgi:hypothetical protein